MAAIAAMHDSVADGAAGRPAANGENPAPAVGGAAAGGMLDLLLWTLAAASAEFAVYGGPGFLFFPHGTASGTGGRSVAGPRGAWGREDGDRSC